MAAESPPPRDPRLGVSSGLMGLGGALMGSAIEDVTGDPNLSQAVRGAVDQTIGMINQRFWQREFEQFQKVYGTQYQQESQRLIAEYNNVDNQIASGVDPYTGAKLDPSKPEYRQVRAKAMQDVISKVTELDMQFMNNAGKFSTNPLIGKSANDLMAYRSGAIKANMGAYGEVVNNQKAEADLEIAQAKAARAPEMVEADIKYKQALAKSAKQKGDEEFRFPPQNVPLPDVDKWLKTDPAGRKALGPYVSALQNAKRAELLERYPNKRFDTEWIKTQLAASQREIEDKAVGMILTENLNPSQVTALGTLPQYEKYFKAVTALEGGIDEPGIRGKVTDKELEVYIKKPQGFGQTALAELERAAREKNFSSINEAIAYVESSFLNPLVQSQVGDFEGARDVRNKILSRTRDYVLQNWQKMPYLAESFAGEVPKRSLGITGMEFQERRGARPLPYEESLLGLKRPAGPAAPPEKKKEKPVAGNVLDRIIDFTLDHERGYLSAGKAKDMGLENPEEGETQHGLIWRTAKQLGLTKEQFLNLSEGEVKNIFKKNYAKGKYGVDKIARTHPKTASVLFDFVIQSGNWGVKKLEKLVGDAIDGVTDNELLDKLKNHSDEELARLLLEERRRFLNEWISKNPKRKKWKNNFDRRLNNLESFIDTV